MSGIEYARADLAGANPTNFRKKIIKRKPMDDEILILNIDESKSWMYEMLSPASKKCKWNICK